MDPSQFLGVVIPGLPMVSEFSITEDQSKLFLDVPNPSEVSDVTAFLLPTCPINADPDKALVIYSAVEPFEEYSLVGVLHPSKPSGLFRTGWATKFREYSSIRLFVSVEDASVAADCVSVEEQMLEERKQYALKVAEDLFNFVTSFLGDSDTNSAITQTIDRWMTRFDEKYKIDPNFMLKK